jgi:hypothetical protein
VGNRLPLCGYKVYWKEQQCRISWGTTFPSAANIEFVSGAYAPWLRNIQQVLQLIWRCFMLRVGQGKTMAWEVIIRGLRTSLYHVALKHLCESILYWWDQKECGSGIWGGSKDRCRLDFLWGYQDSRIKLSRDLLAKPECQSRAFWSRCPSKFWFIQRILVIYLLFRIRVHPTFPWVLVTRPFSKMPFGKLPPLCKGRIKVG